MKDEIKLNGDWYVVETDETITGELHINKIKKQIWLVLTAVTTDKNPTASINVHGRTDIIKGKINTGGFVLLYDCAIGGQHNVNFQKTSVTITAKAAFLALDVEKKEDVCFNQVRIDFGEIIDWTGLCRFEWEVKEKFCDEKLKWVYKDKVEFLISEDVSLEITPHMGSKSLNVTTKEMTINQTVYMYLKYKEETQWDNILRDIKILNNLLTLGMNKAIFIDEIDYYHESHRDKYIPEFISEATVFLGDCREGKHNAGNWFDYLFNLEDLIGNDFRCLKNWYVKYDKLKPIVDLYETAFNYIGISTEMLFLNLAQALETYHARFVSDDYKEYVGIVDEFLSQTSRLSSKDKFVGLSVNYRELLIAQSQINFITLKSRLGDLFLARLDIIFSFLDYRIDEFIQTTLDSRNYFTHYSVDKKNKVFPEKKLPYVNGILLAVLQYYIMKEIEIDSGKIKKQVLQQVRAVNREYDMIK